MKKNVVFWVILLFTIIFSFHFQLINTFSFRKMSAIRPKTATPSSLHYLTRSFITHTVFIPFPPPRQQRTLSSIPHPPTDVANCHCHHPLLLNFPSSSNRTIANGIFFPCSLKSYGDAQCRQTVKKINICAAASCACYLSGQSRGCGVWPASGCVGKGWRQKDGEIDRYRNFDAC